MRPNELHEPQHSRNASGLTARNWSTEEFAASKVPWDELLDASDADPLFMSWDWQWRWWRHHSQVLDATLRLFAIYAGDRIVGLAPFYSHRVVVRRLLRTNRLELIGTAWRDPRATFSDYLDVIAARDYRDAVRDVIGTWLERQPFWNELVICCTRREGVASAVVQHYPSRSAARFVREVDALTGWCAELPPSFEHYVGRLSSDVRRKLFHQRRKLVDPEIQYADEAEVAGHLDELRSYSAERWGDAQREPQVGDRDESWRFLSDFALCMAQNGALRLSRLRSAGATLSVMYNVRVGGTVYFLQSGFDAAGAHGISPGYLHFGYAIEAACKEGVRHFDFLAGPGRHRDYKRDFIADPVAMVTYHIVRGGLVARLYAAYETLTKWIGVRS